MLRKREIIGGIASITKRILQIRNVPLGDIAEKEKYNGENVVRGDTNHGGFQLSTINFQPSTYNGENVVRGDTNHGGGFNFQPSTLQHSTLNFQLSTFTPSTLNLQLSTFNSQPSTFNFQLSTFNFQL